MRFVRNQAEAERDAPASFPHDHHHPCGQDVLNGLAQRRVAAHQVEDGRSGGRCNGMACFPPGCQILPNLPS